MLSRNETFQRLCNLFFKINDKVFDSRFEYGCLCGPSTSEFGVEEQVIRFIEDAVREKIDALPSSEEKRITEYKGLSLDSKLIVIQVRGKAVDEDFKYTNPGGAIQRIEKSLLPFRSGNDYLTSQAGYGDVTIIPRLCRNIEEMVRKLRRIVSSIEDDGDGLWPRGNIDLCADTAGEVYGLVEDDWDYNKKVIDEDGCSTQVDVEEYTHIVYGRFNNW